MIYLDDPWGRSNDLEEVFDKIKAAVTLATANGEYDIAESLMGPLEAAHEAYKAAYEAALEWERMEEAMMNRQYERAAM